MCVLFVNTIVSYKFYYYSVPYVLKCYFYNSVNWTVFIRKYVPVYFSFIKKINIHVHYYFLHIFQVSLKIFKIFQFQQISASFGKIIVFIIC